VAGNHHQVSVNTETRSDLHKNTETDADKSLSYCIVIVLAITLMVLLRRENLRRDTLQLDVKEAEKIAFEDLTDKENPHFRYVY
jgi:hypothetical protein